MKEINAFVVIDNFSGVFLVVWLFGCLFGCGLIFQWNCASTSLLWIHICGPFLSDDNLDLIVIDDKSTPYATAAGLGWSQSAQGPPDLQSGKHNGTLKAPLATQHTLKHKVLKKLCCFATKGWNRFHSHSKTMPNATKTKNINKKIKK
jgi:hypothetical protein